MSTPVLQSVILVPFQPKCMSDLFTFGCECTKTILNFIWKNNEQEELNKLVHYRYKIYGQISKRE